VSAAAWEALYTAAGGRVAIARALEVSESTLYRWSHGLVAVPKVAKVAIDVECKRHGVPAIFDGEPGDVQATGVRAKTIDEGGSDDA
jgi:hypothetical protein